MKKFIIQILITLLLVLILFLIAGFFADGTSDPFYLRFTSHKQKSLILGTSRAAQGLHPKVFDSILGSSNNFLPIYNYAFSLGHSPYGPVYYKAIQKKLDKNTKNGIFIITINPWAISSVAKNPNNPEEFIENDLALGKALLFNCKPNYDYLIKNYKNGWGNLILTKIKKHNYGLFLHNDGWLEVTIQMDNDLVKERIQDKVNFYREENLPYYKLSLLRLSYLEKTIKLLKCHGHVFLVRLPVHEEIFQIEEKLMPDFDSIMNKLSNKYHVEYLNYINSDDSFLYTDGNHLYKTSGKKMSEIIAKTILKLQSVEQYTEY